MFVTHLSIIINRRYRSFPLLSYFSIVVSEVVSALYALVSYISRESWVLFPLLPCSLIVCANNEYIMAWKSCLFVHCTTVIITTIQTYLKVFNFWNTCKVHSVECVSKLKSILFVIFHSVYNGLCVFNLKISLAMILRMCTLSYHPHQNGTMNHLSLFIARSRNNDIRYMSFYVSMD